MVENLQAYLLPHLNEMSQPVSYNGDELQNDHSLLGPSKSLRRISVAQPIGKHTGQGILGNVVQLR